ncbi:hypothetical protein [Myroides odoratus]|uniref:hypothetical protein n=2 Tax=Myroides odoratus TaxID=256 RepID=UPI000A6BE72B|nr:hypothetical protein [Myroides odoratus]
MMKQILKISIVATLFMFMSCSSDDSGSGSCDEAALTKAYETAYNKYNEDQSDANCLAIVKVIKQALDNKCIDQEEADTYGLGLPCY